MEIDGVVGLDLSLTSAGVCRLNFSANVDNEVLLIHCAIGTTTKFGTRLERYRHTMIEINKVVQSRDLVFVEDYAYGIKAKKSMLATMGEIGGLVKTMTWRKTGIEPFLVSPGEWKKFLCGDGRLNKDAFKLKVFQKYKIEVPTNDEAAAIAIAHLGRAVLWDHGGLTSYQKVVVANIRKKYAETLQLIAKKVK